MRSGAVASRNLAALPFLPLLQALNLNGLARDTDIRANRAAAGIPIASTALVRPAQTGAVAVTVVVDMCLSLIGGNPSG
jgi:hypothetical protein